MTRKVQSIDAMLPFEVIRLKVPDGGVSGCTMDEKKRGLFLPPFLLGDSHMNPGSFYVQIHGLLNDRSRPEAFVRAAGSAPA